MLRELSQSISLRLSDDTVFDYSWKYSEKTTVEVDEELEQTTLKAVDAALNELLWTPRMI